MTVDVRVSDPLSGRSAVVDNCGSVAVTVAPYPPFAMDLCSRVQIAPGAFVARADGETDMRQDASVEPQQFYYQSHDVHDTWIVSLQFVISDAGASLNEFGALTALTNGCSLSYRTDTDTVTVVDALRSNFDFILAAGGEPSFGTGNSAFLANNVQGTSEAFLPLIDFTKYIVYGLYLRGGSRDRVIVTINDDTRAIDRFQAFVRAYHVIRPVE